MAHTLVKNSLNTSKAVKIDINLPAFVTKESKGDPIWVLETATTYPSVSGTKIRPVYVDKKGTLENIDEAIDNSISTIASQIEWTPLIKDDSPPYVTYLAPVGEDVSIFSNIIVDIKESVPSAGIDLSDVQIQLDNGAMTFDITDECIITGDPFNYNIRWEPEIVILDRTIL